MARQPARGKETNLFEALRERIAGHALPPGSRLREQDLASEFGVSRARIREAFGALEQRGLIERIPNKGAVVVRLDTEQVLDLYDVREELEGFCARRAAERAPEGGWDDLADQFGPALDAAIAAEDFETYLKAVESLRARMIVHAGSPIMSDMLDLIYDKTRVIWRRVVILPGRIEIGLVKHRELLDAFLRRDTAAAERIQREILSGARAYLQRYQSYVL